MIFWPMPLWAFAVLYVVLLLYVIMLLRLVPVETGRHEPGAASNRR